MATCASDQTIKLWSISDDDAPRHRGTLRGHDGPILSLSFSPDGTRLVSAGRDRTIRIWKLDRSPAIDVVPRVFNRSDYGQLYFLPDGKTLVGDSADGVKIWDTERMQLSGILPGRVRGVTADRKGLHTTGTNVAGEQVFRVWNLQTRSVVKEWPRTGMLPSAEVVSSPDGQIIVLSDGSGTVQFWDASAWRELALRTNHTKSSTEPRIFTRDGSTLFSSDDDGSVQIWDMKTLQSVAVLTGTAQSVEGMALAPDERTLAVGRGDGRIYLWDWQHRKLLATLRGHRQTVYSVDFSPDGKTLVSGSSDGTVKLWNMALRRETATLKLDTLKLDDNGEPLVERVGYVGFSPDGNMLAARTVQGTLKVWRVPSWDEIRTAEQAPRK